MFQIFVAILYLICFIIGAYMVHSHERNEPNFMIGIALAVLAFTGGLASMRMCRCGSK